MGTSAKMIEQHYGTLIDTAHEAILRRLDKAADAKRVQGGDPNPWNREWRMRARLAYAARAAISARWVGCGPTAGS